MGTEKSLIDVYTIPQAPDSFNSGALISQSSKFGPESDDLRIHSLQFYGYLRSPDTDLEILTIQNSAIATEQWLQQSASIRVLSYKWSVGRGKHNIIPEDFIFKNPMGEEGCQHNDFFLPLQLCYRWVNPVDGHRKTSI